MRVKVKECNCEFPLEINQGAIPRCAKCLGIIPPDKSININVHDAAAKEFIEKLIITTNKNLCQWRLASGGFYAPEHETAYTTEIRSYTVVVTVSVIEVHGILGINDKWVVSKGVDDVRLLTESIRNSMRARWATEIQKLIGVLDEVLRSNGR